MSDALARACYGQPVAKLAHSIVQAEGKTPTRSLLFLHGILGTRANWRGIARKVVEARPELAIVLVDLREHGDSLGFPAPHTIEAAARDLIALEASLDLPVRGVLGHSFGGKVAMRYAIERAQPLDYLLVIDSSPGREEHAPAASTSERLQETSDILDALRRLRFPMPDREAFISSLEEQGLARPIAMWLAMNLRRTPDGQRDFPLDLDAIAALLASYYATDTWASVERPRGRTQVHLVIGGRSHVLTPGDQERAQRAAREHDQVTVHVMPEAGHWVHVDAPTELTSLLIDVCGGATR